MLLSSTLSQIFENKINYYCTIPTHQYVLNSFGVARILIFVKDSPLVWTVSEGDSQ